MEAPSAEADIALSSALPPSWALTTLGAVTDYGKTEKVEPADIPSEAWVLELEDIEKDSSRILKRLTQSERQSLSTKNRFDTGDVLYGKLRPYLNKVVIADAPGFCTTEIVPMQAGPALEPRYLFHWLKHPAFLRYVEAASHGMNMPRLGTDAGRAAPLVLAPRPEQTRIADQLDTLLARIQACQDRLEAIPALLKRFRQAVLRAATSGELTRDVRSHFDWSPDWTPMPLTALGELARGKSKHRPRNDPRLYGGPYPFVQTGDVAQSGGLITQHRQTYSELGLQQSRLWPAGTLCITIAANIADTALLTYPACFPDSVVGFIADQSKCEALFVKWSIDVVKDDIEALAPATAQKNINLSVLNEVVIRTPDMAEQREIVRRGKALLAIVDRIEARYADALRQSQRLASLTLAKAFRGELVPQDPNDEPASALLARIATQRNGPTDSATAPTPRRRRPPRAPKETPTMAKSRQDDDVMGQPYLAAHLRRIGSPASAEALFKASELPVADFYKQLAWEVAQGHVKDNQTTLEPGHAAG
jgi:type I restriction enzyme S subunit